MIHELKILPEYFKRVRKGEKCFELRKDDRDYIVGDSLKLMEWAAGKYTGREILAKITYILRDCPEYGLQDGYCILSLAGIVYCQNCGARKENANE